MKRPSFQFYPGDWLNDAALRMVSVSARGLWMDMICLMHQCSDYGYLKVNGKVILTSNLARMIGSTLHEVEGWLKELDDAGVYSIDDAGCIFSRRMIRDEEVRKARADGGFKGGNPKLMAKDKVNLHTNLELTPSSSSSSSSSSLYTQHKNEVVLDDGFNEFWLAYPRKVGKDAAIKAWRKKRPSLDAVLYAIRWQLDSEQWNKNDGQFIPLPTTYINQGRWKDEPLQEISF